jgi:FdhD protein
MIAGSARQAAVLRLRAGVGTPADDWLAEEMPVAFEFNGIAHAVMLASPADLEDFAIGFALCEGIVDALADLHDVEVESGAAGITLRIDIAARCFARLKERRRSLTGRTGCGLCGAESLERALPVLPRVAAAPARLGAGAVSRAVASLRAAQELGSATGATHAAAWCDAAGALGLLREDVGRHNALDKLVGALARGGVAAASGFIAVTSRASIEMVHKAAVAGVPLLAAVSAPTALAVECAQAAGLALAGFARGRDMVVYAHAECLNLEAAAGAPGVFP